MHIELEDADEKFYNDFKEFKEKKRIEELAQRYETKQQKVIKNWISKIRKECCPITKTHSPVKPSMNPKELSKRSKFNIIHS